MIKKIMPLLYVLQFSFFIVFSQTNANKISVYAFKTDNEISNEFKKEMEILFDYYPEAKVGNLIFDANDCNDDYYRCPLSVGYPYTSDNLIGVLKYQEKTIYITSDHNNECKVSLYFEKKRDTVIQFGSYNYYDYDCLDSVVVFDGDDSFFYWTNVIANDSFLIKLPSVEPIKEHEINNNKKKKWYPFRKKISIPSEKIKLKEKFNEPQLIYFVYEIENGIPVYFYSFYSKDESNTDNLVNIILKNFKDSKKLKEGRYLGKAYTRGKYLVIDYTYLKYII